MSILSKNLRYLRAEKGLSQKKLAEELIITRVRLAKYEEAKSEPPFEIMLRISDYFHVSIDLLILIELQQIPASYLLKMEENKLILPFPIDNSGKNYIKMLP
ncbi:MAG: helix-turn-helix domain-containing protein [Saprospiraceae bacterium]